MTYKKARKLALYLAAAVPGLALAVVLAAVTCLLAWDVGDLPAAQTLAVTGLILVALLMAVLTSAAAVGLAVATTQASAGAENETDRQNS